jgi:hypothetical protein
MQEGQQRRFIWGYVIAVGAVCSILSAPVLAAVTDVNGVKVEERFFNDFPSTLLVTTDNYPTQVRFQEGNFTGAGFANRHLATFSNDGGATERSYQSADNFGVFMDVTLSSSSADAEAGFIIRSPIPPPIDGRLDAQFIVKSSGEVAAFGAEFPFYSFGFSYLPGTQATLGMIYHSGDHTIQYYFDPDAGGAAPMQASPFLSFDDGGDFNGIGIYDDTWVGVYGQTHPTADFGSSDINFENFRTPEPASLALLSLGAVFAMRRRRS